jgi:hypothetical protein
MDTQAIPHCFACGQRYDLLAIDGEQKEAVCMTCLALFVEGDMKEAS